MANFPILKKYYYNISNKVAYVVENGKKRKLTVNKKATANNMKEAGAIHGWLTLNKQKKIQKVLTLMQIPSADAVSNEHICEGRVDVVIK